MQNLLTAIYGKTSGLSFPCYLDQAPQGTEFPYCVFFVVSGVPEKTFSEHYTNTLIQFSLFSASSGATEITTMYKDLKALFDECSLTIPPTGTATDTLIWMREANLTTMMDEITVADATTQVRHWACDYEIMTSLN
jgi:hypothetical protein